MATQATNLIAHRIEPIESGEVATSPTIQASPEYANRSSAAAAVLPLLLALGTITAPVAYGGLGPIAARFVSCSTMLLPFRRRKGQRISIHDARRIALRVLSEANAELQRERALESRFVFRFWDDQVD